MPDPHIPHPAGCACPRCAPDLAPGDVALFRVPVPGGRGRPEARPCLVVDVATLGDERLVLLAPGVPAAGRPAGGGDLHAAAEDLRGVPGLAGPVAFLAGERLLVSVAHPGFERDGTGSPVLGRLGDGALRRLDALGARLEAGRDRAAGHGRGGGRRGPAVRGRDFVVERRHPRRRGRPAGIAASGAEPERSADRVAGGAVAPPRTIPSEATSRGRAPSTIP